jgi:hypothetical protein
MPVSLGFCTLFSPRMQIIKGAVSEIREFAFSGAFNGSLFFVRRPNGGQTLPSRDRGRSWPKFTGGRARRLSLSLLYFCECTFRSGKWRYSIRNAGTRRKSWCTLKALSYKSNVLILCTPIQYLLVKGNCKKVKYLLCFQLIERKLTSRLCQLQVKHNSQA